MSNEEAPYESTDWYVSTYGDTNSKDCLLDDLKMLLCALHRVMRDIYLYENDVVFCGLQIGELNKSLDNAATNTLAALENVSEAVSDDYQNHS